VLFRLPHLQASLIAEELLKQNPGVDVFRIVYNKFVSAIAFKPTVSTVMMPNVGGSSCRPTPRSTSAADLSIIDSRS